MPTRYVQPGLIHRRRWNVAGQVQGVGFRPFVYRIARELGLRGFVRNDPAGVTIEAQGAEDSLDRFAATLVERRPALARVDQLSCVDVPLCADDMEFLIETSADCGSTMAEVTVDTATCADCVAELLDPTDRRTGYGLINCTNCGPRFTIIRQVPYDRPNTTMAGFAMCPACADGVRRPGRPAISCAAGGVPRLRAEGGAGGRRRVRRLQAIRSKARWSVCWRDGFVAIKGLGGFHLAVRADNPVAVGRLRQNKHRDRKPFAVMCAEYRGGAEAGGAERMPPRRRCSRRRARSCSHSEAGTAHRRRCRPRQPSPGRDAALHADSASAVRSTQHSAPRTSPGDDQRQSSAMSRWSSTTRRPSRRLGGICDAILWHDRPDRAAGG